MAFNECDLASIKMQVFNLRKQGMAYHEISDLLGISIDKAHACIRSQLKQLKAHRVEIGKDLIDQELAILDQLIKAVMPSALEGDPKAAETVLKVLARRTKYLGLDEVQKLDLSGSLAVGEAILEGFMARKPKP